MPEIVQVKKIYAFAEDGKLKGINPSGVFDVQMSSVQELLELAETFGEPIVFQDGKHFIFKHELLYYYAKQ